MDFEKQKILDTILAWAESTPNVRAVVLIGSEAQAGGHADEWSDLDLVVMAREPEVYVRSPDWMAEIGEYTLHTVERGAGGVIHERRAVFDNGVDVDFIVLSAESCVHGLDGTWVGGIAAQGMKVLLDKDGVLAQPPAPSPNDAAPPSQLEFEELAADFWYHIVWTAKKLKRGELWTAKRCCDGYMKGLLLRMIEWHARATKGWNLDVRYEGRFLERWADPDVVSELGHVYATYDEDDVWRALSATADLFRRIAKDTAQRLGYDWLPEQSDAAMEWVRTWRE